jgi:hypothetical protein
MVFHVKLVEVRGSNEILLGRALHAIAAFCERVAGSNVSFSWLAERTVTCYRTHSPLMLLLVVLDDREAVVGHCLAFAEDHYGVLVGFCYQAHLGPGGSGTDRRAIVREGRARLIGWAQEVGCKKLRAATQRNPDAFARLFGLHKVLNLMEMDLEG